MTARDAEEFTESLGQIVAGSWRQIALANRLGVPKALGLSLESWVRERLGGYVRLSIDERRKAAIELNGEGYSQREIGAAIGVDQKTVQRVLASEANASNEDRNREKTEQDSELSARAEANASLAVAAARSKAIDRQRREQPQRFAADEIYDALAFAIASAEQWAPTLTPTESGRQRAAEWSELLQRLHVLTARLVEWQAERGNVNG